MQSRAQRIYSQFAEPVTGYELNPERGLFSVIVPEATTNLVTNSSFGGGVETGWEALEGAIGAISTWQAYGAYGLRVEPDGNPTENGAYYETIELAAGTTYTASVTIQGEAGKLYYLWFATSGGALIGAKGAYRGTGHKQRIWVTYAETANASRRIYITRDARHADLNYFYLDGLQVEAKAYPTTYCDGDIAGFVISETAYLWNGTPHASTSTRSAQTRTGGREVNLFDLGLRILAVVGLGMNALVDQSLAIPGLGEMPQGTGTQAREFQIVGALNADSARHLKAVRSGLIDVFKPDAVVNDQPLILRYQEYDEEGDPCGESLDIICKYRGGLEGQWDNNTGERVALGFKMYLPMIKATFGSGTALGYQTAVANANYILMRTSAGVWQEMAGGANGFVQTFAQGNDGAIYAGGIFTNLGSGAGDKIASWNGTAWSAVGTGADAEVLALAVGPDGAIYAGGNFNLAGGVAGTVKVAKWDGAVWTPLAGGANAQVEALAFGIDGSLYMGGLFTDLGGANGDRISRWDGAAWNPMGTGANSDVNAIAIGPDGTVYAGGAFTSMGGVANTSRIAKWNGAAWSALGSGMNNSVFALTVGSDGSLYAYGSFTSAGGIANTNNIARWDGTTWQPLGTGLSGGTPVSLIKSIYFDAKNNLLYVGGNFTGAGGVTISDGIAVWNGSVWFSIDVNFPGATSVYGIFKDRADNLYAGFSSSGVAISATVTGSVSGSARAFPTVTFTGPGTLWQLKNYTTGKAIYFNLTLLAGETAVLNLDPLHFSFTSSFRGNLLAAGAILPGSNTNFELMPGANNVSAYMYGATSAATAITMTWQDQYNSLDGAAWK